MILADLRMDVETIATALLHDALEDNPITKEQMAAEVGETVTDLGRWGHQDRQAAVPLAGGARS